MSYSEILLMVGFGFLAISAIAYISSKTFKGNSYTKPLDWVQNRRTIRNSRVAMVLSFLVFVAGVVWVLVDKLLLF